MHSHFLSLLLSLALLQQTYVEMLAQALKIAIEEHKGFVGQLHNVAVLVGKLSKQVEPGGDTTHYDKVSSACKACLHSKHDLQRLSCPL